jgi:multidrug efflux pump
MGVPVETIGRTLETLLGGRQVTRFKRDGEQYDVIVQVANVDRSNPDDIRDIYVRGRDGSMISLDNLVRCRKHCPRELNHFGQRRAVTITANLAPGYTMGEALQLSWTTRPRKCCHRATRWTTTVSHANSASLHPRWPDLSAWRWPSSIWCWRHSSRAFRDPFIIMLTVPLSMAGALLASAWPAARSTSIARSGW